MAFTAYHDAVSGPNAALYQMIVRLLAHGWTVPDSGDGRSVFGTPGSGIYGNGTNVITGASAGGSYVANQLNNSYAWIRLRSPLGAGGPEIMIQHGLFNQGTHVFHIWFMLNAGAGPYTGAASDNPGTPNDIWQPVFYNNPTPGAPNNAGTIFYHTGAGTLDMMVGDAAEGYAFYAMTRMPAATYLTGIIFDYCRDAQSNDESPYVFYCNGDRGSDAFGTSIIPDGRSYWNLPNPSYPYGAYESKTIDPTPDLPRKLSSWQIPWTTSGSPAPSAGCLDAVNPYATEYDVLEGVLWMRAGTQQNSSGYSGLFGRVKGISTLIKGRGPRGPVTDGNTNVGRTMIAQGSGDYWLLWDGATLVNADVTVNLIPFITTMEETELLDPAVVGNVLYTETIESTRFAPGIIQRVWDDGSGGRWCYYEKPSIDPSPASGETSPPYTGSISHHGVVRYRER